MLVLAFELSMPNRNSWNGRWSGDDKSYVVTRRVSKAEVDKLGDYYQYDFGDGWSARVAVREVDANEAARLRRKSNGFCGYDWMVDSILRHGKIQAPA